MSAPASRSAMPQRKSTSRSFIGRRGVIHAAGAALAWVALTGGAADLLAAGAVVSVATGAAVARLLPRMEGGGISAIGAAAWLPGFLWRTLMGALDVARRVLDPALPINPHFQDYRSVSPAGWPRAIFTGVISLTPGSLAAGTADGQLAVHLLSDSPDLMNEVKDEDRRVAKLTAGRREETP